MNIATNGGKQMRLQFTITKVASSWIKGIDFRQGILTLDLGDRLYAYRNVPAKEALGLLEAKSAGTYFNERIKDCYEWRELT